MFERFTEGARHALVIAQQESRRRGHDYIGTEHLLLGVITVADGPAAQVLAQLNIAPAVVEQRVSDIIGVGQGTAAGQVAFAPRASKVLELALNEALTRGDNHIGTEHLLLGLVREGAGVAAIVLTGLGASLSKVRELLP